MDLLYPVVVQFEYLQLLQTFEGVLEQASENVFAQVENFELFLGFEILGPERVQPVMGDVQHLQLAVEPQSKVHIGNCVGAEIDVSHVRIKLDRNDLEGCVDTRRPKIAIGLAGTQ